MKINELTFLVKQYQAHSYNSPAYFEATQLLKNKADIDQIYVSYTQKYNIPFLDYTYDSICHDTANSYNPQHLKAKGGAKLNYKLANDLKKYLEQ